MQPFLERSIQIIRSRVHEHILEPDHAFCARICRAYARCPGACTGAHTLIGYGATVMRRLIRKWSGQLCEGVNNDPGSHRVNLYSPCSVSLANSTALSSRDHRPKSPINRNHRLEPWLARSYRPISKVLRAMTDRATETFRIEGN